MGILDIILGVLLAYGLFRGLKNGFFVEIASVIALVAGIYGTIHFSYITSDYLNERLDWDATYIKITAFIITFLGIMVVVHLLGKALTRVADFAMLGLLNRIAGGIFGIVKVAVILGSLMIFLERAGLPLHEIQPEAFEKSIFYGPLKDTGAFIFSSILEADPLTLPEI